MRRQTAALSLVAAVALGAKIMKLQPVNPATNGHQEPAQEKPAVVDRFFIEENDDNSVSFKLTDGTPIKLRELLTEDITKIEQFVLQNEGKAGSTAIAMKLIALLCIQWGEQKSIRYEDLMKQPLRKMAPDLKRFNKVFEFFRLEDLFSAEGD